jgi:hypothetical protein
VALADLFSRFRKDEPDVAKGVGIAASLHPTKALGPFLSSLSSREQPSLLDLGPVVGSNVNFFGEQLGCKIFVEDVFKDLDRHVTENKVAELPSFLAKRLPQETETIDGVLCWDVFDYLDRAEAQSLAQQLVRVLRPDGVLLAFFNSVEPVVGTAPVYTKHVVADRANFEHRPYRAMRSKRRPMANRDIQRLFDPLTITEQFLLKTNIREVLFRKPGPTMTKPPAGWVR